MANLFEKIGPRFRSCEYRRLFFLLCFFVGPAVISPGFQSDQQAQLPVIKVETELVEVPVTVTDKKGNPVTDLTVDDLRIYEDGIEQILNHFTSSPGPVSWGLILDISGSMAMMIDEVHDSAIHMVEAATPRSEAFIITFNNQPNLILEFTSNRDRMRSSISGLIPGGNTTLWDAVSAGLHEMKKAKYNRKAIVVVTDGDDNESLPDSEDLIERVRESDILIYSVAMLEQNKFLFWTIGNNQTPRVLQTLAEASGAYAHSPRSTRECRRDMERIAVEVSHQYLLGYYPLNDMETPRFRELKVLVQTADGIRPPAVRARKGYFGPRERKDHR